MDKNILAYFAMDAKARQAAKKLKEKGFETVQVDRIDKFPDNGYQDKRQNNPIANQSLSVAALTQKAGEEDLDNVKPLLATDPVSSGLSGPGPTGENWLVTVVADESRLQEALAILDEYGARH